MLLSWEWGERPLWTLSLFFLPDTYHLILLVMLVLDIIFIVIIIIAFFYIRRSRQRHVAADEVTTQTEDMEKKVEKSIDEATVNRADHTRTAKPSVVNQAATVVAGAALLEKLRKHNKERHMSDHDPDNGLMDDAEEDWLMKDDDEENWLMKDDDEEDWLMEDDEEDWLMNVDDEDWLMNDDDLDWQDDGLYDGHTDYEGADYDDYLASLDN